jgi:phosphate transport system substrate-binding protein
VENSMHWRVYFISLLVLMQLSSVEARDHVEVAGSSTVFPFTAAVIQRLKAIPDVNVVNRSTGTGGGMHAFCGGTGDEFPDITGASRSMKDYERQYCNDNGVNNITVLPIGYDGIVLASASGTPRIQFTLAHLYQALAREVVKDGTLVPNPHRTWRDVDASLPDWKILVLGPPSTSGTRDTFEQLALKPACESFKTVQALEPQRSNSVCTTIRRDGHYVELGEDDIEIIKQLRNHPESFGIFGYSYVVQYKDIVRPNPVDGILPTDESIDSRSYPLSRPLYLYVKDVRLHSTPGLTAFLQEYTSDHAFGSDGYLSEIGLVPLNNKSLQEVQCNLDRLLGIESSGCVPDKNQ